ncbi:hypothetical protein L6164_001923 [Bauhinia variegata]|uniref:Uncharacterized protein n=1 Tax=Bauhinia variegata TaxID=167791 RepID=A0ACB9QCJ5_BAUVA|nr:hypothetical protein L6164_001923 [Bauhinia variegata]
MGESSKTLEITVISAENLSVDHNPVTENAYVTVRTESIKCCKTSMAREGGSHPSWNEKFLLEMPMHAKSINFEVQCKMSTGIVKSVGVARIAISDFLGESVPESSLQFLRYSLRNWDGGRSGIINFTARVKSPEEDLCSEEKPEKETGVKPRSCGMFENEVMGIQIGEKNAYGVVTGIPVWWNNNYRANI